MRNRGRKGDVKTRENESAYKPTGPTTSLALNLNCKVIKRTQISVIYVCTLLASHHFTNSLSLSRSLFNHINDKPLFFQTLEQSYYTKTLISLSLSLNLSRDLAAFSGDVIPAKLIAFPFFF